MLRKQRIASRPRRNWVPLVMTGLWAVLCVSGSFLGYRLGAAGVDDLALEHARAVFETVVNFRAWNAAHGGVFVSANTGSEPNPYLPADQRTLESAAGEQLVMVNPAYMTRQVGEITVGTDGLLVRVTSLLPLRPENKAFSWESKALRLFAEKDLAEFSQFAWPAGKEPQFHYASPLLTKASCLECHAAQGYQVGDIRGAVTLAFPAGHYSLAKLSLRQNAVWLGGLVFLLGLAVIYLLARAARGRRQALAKAKEMTLHDSLTGLHNRRGFDIRAEQALETLARERGSAVLAFADLDQLKELNDIHGHQEGDAALRLIGKALGQTFRGSDVVARIGGDEFALLLMDATWENHSIIRERIDNSVCQANQSWHGSVALALSVGLVPIDLSRGQSMPAIQDLLASADEKMYSDKKRRRKS